MKIIAPDGKVVAESARTVKYSKVTGNIKVADPQLWSPETPSLYKLEICLTDNGKETDKIEETFGIRSIRYSATDGFRLNGKPIVLNGACAHHDNGML